MMDLTQALATRLQLIAPSTCHVRAIGGELVISDDRTRDVATSAVAVLLANGLPKDEAVANACLNALNALQDFQSELATEPWPMSENEPTKLALPGVSVCEGVVALWFGSRSTPVLRVSSINIDEID